MKTHFRNKSVFGRNRSQDSCLVFLKSISQALRILLTRLYGLCSDIKVLRKTSEEILGERERERDRERERERDRERERESALS